MQQPFSPLPPSATPPGARPEPVAVASVVTDIPSLRAAAGTLFAGSLTLMAVAGLSAMLLKETLLFPSLGPTAMLFFARPLPPEVSVRTVVIGHWVGIAVGWLCLVTFGLVHSGAAVTGGVTATRVAAAALSVAVTAGILRVLRSPHAPAGASTLIVSLGVLTTGTQLAMMAASVVLVAVAGWGANRLVGVRVPFWPRRKQSPPSEFGEVVAEYFPLAYPAVTVPHNSATQLIALPHLLQGGQPQAWPGEGRDRRNR